MALPGPSDIRLRRESFSPERAASLRESAARARERAARTRTTVTEILAQERKRLHQHRIDDEVATTERSLDDLLVPARTRYPALDFFDPYFLAGADRQTLLTSLLDTALRFSSAEKGNVQLLDPARNELLLTAHRGFERPFLTFFDRVGADGTACAAAAADAVPVVIPEVERAAVFDEASRETVLGAGVRAVQSVPLITSAGEVVGVLSCHYEKPYPAMEDDELLLTALADATARSLQWHNRPEDGAGARAHRGR